MRKVFNQKQLDTEQSLGFLLGTGTLLGQKHGLDVGQHTTLGNGHACQELVQFLIVPGHKSNGGN